MVKLLSYKKWTQELEQGWGFKDLYLILIPVKKYFSQNLAEEISHPS